MTTRKMTIVKSAAVVLAVALLAECGASEPSNKEVAQGMVRSFVQETGASSKGLKAKAKEIGNGRWAVTMEAERYGRRRTLNATAVMDILTERS